ncbi:baseplate J/gp47 family protein [Polyangium sorediatum]|uniref:Baseplate J/gp47 family protein n=1 Tax=Polyangium sorediatum TaxID=889274 RepID=A0ABT6NPE8_9BACT|nr:baseplate J/gp47 family protein [Polyangium sorediatum]MDI1430184.1 baseplate J/gp47 family protein [Polyangium sorediatum]
MSGIADRAKLLRLHPELNGIDFVEIANIAQTEIRIHFMNPVDDLVGVVTGATITGGDAVPKVPVLPIDDANDWDVPAKVLTLRVAAPGDFSTYTLALQSASGAGTQSLDPYFDHAPFSFKVGCPALVDCEAQAAACAPLPADPPPIDYLAKDFESFRRALLEFSARRYPAWEERSPADFGVMFLETLSSVADDLSYLQDRIAAEAWLETATERRSVVRHARLVDYEPRPATAARVLLQFEVTGGPIGAGLPVSTQGPDGTTLFFETGIGLGDQTKYPVNPLWNKIEPHWWNDDERCLHSGATEMWVEKHGLGLTAGQKILIDTLPATPGDPPVREFVTLAVDGEERIDPLAGGGGKVTRLVWRPEDALRRDHDLTRTSLAANLVPATQGQRFTETFATESAAMLGQKVALTRTGPEGTPQYLFPLDGAPLAWLYREDAPDARPWPEIRVTQVNTSPARPWVFRRNLLDAESFDEAFTVDPVRYARVGLPGPTGAAPMEYDGAEGDTIRFGDGSFGVIPEAKSVFQVTYRVGGGATGNVAADSITRIVPGGMLEMVAAKVTNPFPATGGADPETDEAVRKLAPHAFRAKTRRAVRKEDYERIAGELPWVQRAGTTFRYTGSWLSVFTAPDPRGTGELSLDRRIELIEELERVRLAGYESHVLPPHFVALDIVVEVCARRDAFKADVREAVLEALSAARRPDGSTGFFHLDRFTFGQGLWRSALEAAVQRVHGVDGVRVVQFRRRGSPIGFIDMPALVKVGKAEILRVDSNPSRPERGSVDVLVEGGK